MNSSIAVYVQSSVSLRLGLLYISVFLLACQHKELIMLDSISKAAWTVVAVSVAVIMVNTAVNTVKKNKGN